MSGTLLIIRSSKLYLQPLVYIYTCGDRPLSRLGGNWIHLFINAKQAIEIRAYKDTKRKLYKMNAAILFNKTCRDKELTPNYINIKINGSSSHPAWTTAGHHMGI